MVCAVCLSIFLWICGMAGLLHETFMSWWYLPRIWPSVTDVQHYYHARYPTDDWHLAYMFSLVYFSVEVCLEGVFPHSVSTRQDSCVRVYAPLTLAPPSRKKNRTWVTQLSTWTKRRGIWTYACDCLHYWVVIWVADSLISTYIAQFMGFVIGRIHYGLSVVFCFIHITAFHYHHCARQLIGTEYM